METLLFLKNTSSEIMRLVIRIIDIIVALIELALTARFVLELLGANPGAGFVQWVYSTTAQLMVPFAHIFPTILLGGDNVLDLSTLCAMAVYAFIRWILVQVLSGMESLP